MARRRKKQDTAEQLVLLIILIIKTIIKLIFRIIVFSFDLITFYTSRYKEKSGNSFIKTYFDKGNYGEFILYRKLIRTFDKKSVLTNIYLENVNTDSTEIDVIAVSTKGIYVFEMKNYSGYIYGSERDRYWTQVLNKWVKNKFYNPLRQNYVHTKAIEKYLSIKSDSIIPVTVFSNNSKLSKINVGKNHNVFQYRDAIKFVKNKERRDIDILTIDMKEAYLIDLVKQCNMPEDVKIKHIEQVKALVGEN
ncbi:MAG: nuclease-related domain-containing protein [Candidatus Izemoplasma sp.]|nr:nuclease-related domain-containing protein [Candidatus Izemoplasma sp.]